jgi:hypothetical protein
VTLSDGCGGTLTTNCTPGTITTVGTCGKSQAFTLKATDGCLNCATNTVTFTWTEDTTRPVFTGGGSFDLGCNPTLPDCALAWSKVTLSDGCGGTLTTNCTPGTITTVGTCGKSQAFTLKATDGCLNCATNTVTFTWTEDTTRPVFTGGGSFDLGCNPTLPDCALAWSKVTLSDGCGGTLTTNCTPGTITTVGTCGKSQAFTLKATDSCLNCATNTVTFTWTEDTTRPVFTGGGSFDLGCNPTLPDCALAWSKVTLSDGCGGTLTTNCTPGTITTVGTCGKSQAFTLKATDSCLNCATNTVTFTWTEDTTRPVFTGGGVSTWAATRLCPTALWPGAK